MRLLIVVPDESGNIVEAAVHDVQNEATWQSDGGLMLEDGRVHSYPSNLLLFDPVSPLTHDVLAWWRMGKYVVVNGELHEVEGWTPPSE